MTAPDEAAARYQAEQLAAVAAAVAAAGGAASLAGLTLANYTVFAKLLRLIYPLLLVQRKNAAFSARRFYDLERLYRTGLPPKNIDLVGYDFATFEKALRPAYDVVVKQLAQARELEKLGLPQPKPKIATTVGGLVAREVSGAGREQILAAVEADGVVDLDSPQRRVGWARKQTGRETCPFCLMLVSRGAVYGSAKAAGEGKAFHPFCDCLIVPVFDGQDWPGKAEADAALAVWRKASRKVNVDPEKKYRVRQKDGTYRMQKLPASEAETRETLMKIREGFATSR